MSINDSVASTEAEVTDIIATYSDFWIFSITV